jgi:hypothetical protein
LQWIQYYPLLFDGRWQANVFYGFDFTKWEMLLSAGAYADAAAGLTEVIGFLDDQGDTERAAHARSLMAKALKGQEATILIGRLRQSVQSRDYHLALDLASQAEQAYLEIDDRRRLDEIEGYRAQARRVLTWREALAEVSARPDWVSSRGTAETLVDIGRHLADSGDVESIGQINEMLSTIEARQRNQAVESLVQGLGIVASLVVLRLILLLRRPAPEVKLL